MKPGQTSLPRASISSSTAPEKLDPTCTTRSPSHTTTPSRMRVCPPPAKPTTQPPRIRPRIWLTADERAGLDELRALAIGCRGHREEPGVVHFGLVAIAGELGRLGRPGQR